MMVTPDLYWQIGVTLVTGGAIYGGIRADLKAMHERITSAQSSADKAHERLDNHIDKGK